MIGIAASIDSRPMYGGGRLVVKVASCDGVYAGSIPVRYPKKKDLREHSMPVMGINMVMWLTKTGTKRGSDSCPYSFATLQEANT